MTLRRLWVLVSGLPQDARTNTQVYGEAAIWTPQYSQGKRMEFALSVANWQRAGGKGKKPKEPKPPRIGSVRIELPDDI